MWTERTLSEVPYVSESESTMRGKLSQISMYYSIFVKCEGIHNIAVYVFLLRPNDVSRSDLLF